MRCFAILTSIAVLLESAITQIPSLRDFLSGKQPFVDRLHGFSVQLPPFWSAKVLGNAIVIKDYGLHFIVIRGTRYNGNIKQVAQKWLSEKETTSRYVWQFTGNRPRFAFRQTQHGIVIYGEGLPYPYNIDPQTSINFSFLASKGIQLPNEYREVTAILPGKSMAILVTMLFPSNSDEANRKQMLEIVKSFRFLSAEEMVSWRPEQIRCYETGLEAAAMHVPEGFEFRAGVIRQDKKRRFAFFLRKGETMLRKDYIDLTTNIIQSPFGGTGGHTILIINGQSSQQPNPIVVTSKEDSIQLVLAIWRAETGKEWQLKESVEIPSSPLTKAVEEVTRREMTPLQQVIGTQGESFNMAFVAESDGLLRLGLVSGAFSVMINPHQIASTQGCFVGLEVTLSQMPKGEFEWASSIFNGFNASLLYNPEWIVRTAELWSIEHIQESKMLRQMLSEHREFNTRMATAWTNLLSDQTYVKDPETNEIFRLHKRSWETGDFWREPVFGDVILGGVERGSKLEELLKMEGWRSLTESLEGFPEMWK